ncbi:MAG: MFS transporter, partial [Clostridia bacterium]
MQRLKRSLQQCARKWRSHGDCAMKLGDSKSRTFFAFGEASMATVDQLSGGIYLAALMVYLGMSDADIGIVLSVGSLAALFQLLTLRFGFLRQKKKLITCLMGFQRVWMALFFVIPFFPISQTAKVSILVVGYSLSRILITLGGPATSTWISELVPIEIRGRYFGTKDAISMAVMSLVLLVSGMIIDRFEGELRTTAFAILAVMVLVLSLCGLFLYWKARDTCAAAAKAKPKTMGMLAQIKHCFAQASFRKIFFLDCLWMLTFYIAAPYNAGYSIKQLAIHFTFLSVVGFVGNIARIFIARKMGKLADRHGMARMLRYAVGIFGIHYLIWALMVPSNAQPMYLVMQALSSLAWSFIGVGQFGIKLDLMPEEERPMQFAVSAALSGVVGFGMSYAGGLLLAALEKTPIVLIGVQIFPQQVLNLLGAICSVGMCAYLWFLLEKP